MSKKYMIPVLILFVLVLVGSGYYWKTKKQKPVVTDTVIVNPVVVSPTESVQGTNPYDKTNPYSNIKVNPFE